VSPNPDFSRPGEGPSGWKACVFVGRTLSSSRPQEQCEASCRGFFTPFEEFPEVSSPCGTLIADDAVDA
jgi:hypothetical protein